MATFASPAPRKTHRHATPRQSSGTPPRQRRLVGTRVVSGTTPTRSVGSGMDVDATPTSGAYTYTERTPKERDTVFAKTEELVVGLYGGLPVEIRQVLRSTDFLAESYTGGIDITSGYTLVASARTCFVWSHATLKPSSPSPTCYILPCPPPSPIHPNSTPQAPHHALIPSRTRSVEPGLILVSPTGTVRFWPSISSGLSGGGTFEAVHLPLEASEEYVSCFMRADQGGAGGAVGVGAYVYLAATSTGRIFRLGVTSQGGKHTLTARLFAPPAASSSLSLTRLLGWSAPSPTSRPEPGNVVALVSSGNDMYALVESRIQKWTLGTEEMVVEADVGAVVREAIGGGEGIEDLEGVDLAVESPNTLVLLVSYASMGSEENPTAMVVDQFGYGPRRVYAIVRLVSHEDSCGVDGVIGVPYVATAASPPAHPRVTLLSGGAVIAVLFGEVVIFCARDTPYQDRLVLKSPTDRLLGLCALPPVISLDHNTDADSSMDTDGGDARDEAEVVMMTSGTMLKVCVDVESVRGFKAESLPNLLKATLKQAILYSPIPANPLQFILPPSPVLDGEALMRAAEGTSAGVITSDAEIVRPNHDLTCQLTARKERLSWLIRFINDNGALGKMSQRSRQRLATDAEKLYACHQLWIRLNEHIDSGATHSLITDSIHAFTATHASTTSTPSSHHESPSTPEQTPTQDVVRDFFKYRVSDVGRLLVFMVDYLGRLGGSGLGGIGALKEIGGAVVTTLQAALSYRAYNLGVYGVDLPMIKPWTSRPAIIDAMLKLVDAVTRVAAEGAGASASGNAKEVVGMLPELATLLFACVQERLDWLGSPMAADEPGTERDRTELEDRFAQLRPEILETLRITSHLQQALSLATTYTDFSSLASLLLRSTPYPPSSNPHAPLIKDYLDRYGDAFGREVVRWCVEQGEARVVFAEEDVWGPVMDGLFGMGKGKGREGDEGRTKGEYNGIAWVNDMGRGRFGEASGRLLKEAKGAGEVGVRHFMLSLGKLSQLAQLQEGGSVEEATLDDFHDGLDFIAVQEKLLKDFQSALGSLRGKQKQSLDAQVDAVVRAKATNLRESERKGLIGVFRNHVRQVLQVKVLNVEDAVDVLTLKDNAESIEDYSTALHLLFRAEDLPDVRRLSSFRRAWCRVYNHDDWDAIRQTANITDSQLTARFRATALYNTLSLVLPTIFSTSPNDTIPEGFDLEPSQCLPVPLMPETSSRFPGIPAEMVGELARDFRAESSSVEGMKLEDVYFRVRELVMEDLGFEMR